MIKFICLFFPAVISISIYEAIIKTELKRKELIYKFCGNTLIINFIVFLIKKIVLHTAESPLCNDPNDMVPNVAINFLIMAIPIACFVAIFEIILSQKVKITVEEAFDETEKKKS